LEKVSELGKPLNRLVWGELPFSLPAIDQEVSDLMPDAGVATLRVRGSDHTLAVKFGPHGGGHGHRDKLTFISFANGAHLAADAGSQAYAARSHATWDKTTLAHNTVVIDETDQAEATGKLLSWTALPDAVAIELDAGPAYNSARLQRRLVHMAEYTLDLFDVKSLDGRPHRIDWLHHNYSRQLSIHGPDAAPPFPVGNGYQHLSAGGAVTTPAPWEVAFEHFQLYMLGGESTTMITGQALGPDLRVPLPFVMARREALETRFAALYEPFRKEPGVRSFERAADGRYLVKMAGFQDEISLDGGRLQVVRKSRERPLRLVLSGIAKHALLERRLTTPIEIKWSEDGGAVEVLTAGQGQEPLRILAPRALRVSWNGAAAACRIDGDYRVIIAAAQAPSSCR
jgi:hypothetical protein